MKFELNITLIQVYGEAGQSTQQRESGLWEGVQVVTINRYPIIILLNFDQKVKYFRALIENKITER